MPDHSLHISIFCVPLDLYVLGYSIANELIYNIWKTRAVATKFGVITQVELSAFATVILY